jgi:ubiquinone/menaquinone biosynthesis C-methylase UbiE
MDIRQHLMCPDCKIKLEEAGYLKCRSCGRIFTAHDNFFNLLPSHLNQEDLAEERFWSTDATEGLNADPKLTFQMKRLEIDFFREKMLSRLRFEGKILEIGSGACWLSSMVKLAAPETFIVASDVSPSALAKGEKLSRLLNAKIDAFVACKIESLPFETGFFDYVVGSAILHHTKPQKALIHIFRVLKKDGKFVGTGETVIPKAFSAIWTSRLGVAGRRQRELGVKEGTYSFAEWMEFLKNAGFNEGRFSLRMDPKYKRRSGLIEVYFIIASRMPSTFVIHNLPCVVVMFASK